MDDMISACSNELGNLIKHDEELKNFLQLIKQVNSLPQVRKQSRSDSRCLYEAVARGVSIHVLEQNIGDFFSLQKPSGAKTPLLLTFNKTVRMLRGIRSDQSFFMQKTGAGEIYGALWPWQSEQQTITILLGLNGDRLKGDEYKQLEDLVEQVCSQKI